MSNYEDLIEEMEYHESDNLSPEAREAAVDAMAFVYSLHDMYAKQNKEFGDFPDCAQLESVIDCIHGELSALCMVLAEPAFDKIPDILREITDNLAKVSIDFNEDLQSSKLAPSIVQGYARLADRITMTKESIYSFSKRVESVRETLRGEKAPESATDVAENCKEGV